ncbi:MAG: shikimate kinase [Chitinophagaceae bacterium]|nr:shikimate kinase [Chitinophagaceae bacterium]
MKIFLLGMMGSGKSHWKQQLAKLLKTGGYDLDTLVEFHEEKTIAEIFEQDGEAYFRKKEAELLRWFKEKKHFVVATGGGTPCFHDNMQYMNQEGVTIWLNEPIDVLVKRLLPEKEHRPLIKNISDEALGDFLQQKLAERQLWYSLALETISGEDINLKTFKKIIAKHA